MHIAETIAGIERVTISAHLCRELLPLPEGSVYLGFRYVRASSVEAVEAVLRESHVRLQFVIEGFDSNTEPAKRSFVPADSPP